MTIGTAIPFSSVGVNFHWRTASSAAASRSGIDRSTSRADDVAAFVECRFDDDDALDARRPRDDRVHRRHVDRAAAAP